MKLSLFWKLMLSFTIVVAIGLGAVIVLAGQVTTNELHQFMMGSNSDMQGMMGQGRGGPGPGQQLVIDRVNRAVLIGGLSALVAALLIGFFVFRTITRPIEHLTLAAHSLTKGDLTARVPLNEPATRLGQDELSELSAAFNSMAAHLQQAEQLRRDLTADVAHELRTPLSVIRANLEAMLDGVYPLDAEHVQPALDQANLLSRLIDDLRTLALAEAGQLTLTKRPIDLRALIASTLTSHTATAAAHHVALRAEVAADLPTLTVDPDRLQQAIAILIDNALRYTPTNGSITVAARHDQTRMLIEVTDTGSGIAPDDVPHVFERFYRADKSRSRDSGGSGLGLAIAKSIVAAHGGMMGVASTADHGTTMTINLPVDPTTRQT